jgi:hypothetical protein
MSRQPLPPEERARRKRESHRKAQKKWRNKNRTKVYKTQTAWHQKNPGKRAEYRRTQYYRTTYGMEEAEAKAFIAAAGKCGNRSCGSTKRLVIDHDHRTGKIRGVLCDACNKGIGLLGDTKEGLEQALAYLQ